MFVVFLKIYDMKTSIQLIKYFFYFFNFLLRRGVVLPFFQDFIDCHVHLRSDGLADPRAQQAADTDAVALLRSARNARRTLECGRHHDPRLRLPGRHRLRACEPQRSRTYVRRRGLCSAA